MPSREAKQQVDDGDSALFLFLVLLGPGKELKREEGRWKREEANMKRKFRREWKGVEVAGGTSRVTTHESQVLPAGSGGRSRGWAEGVSSGDFLDKRPWPDLR